MQLTEHFKLEEFAVSRGFPELAKKIQFTHEDIIKLFYFCSLLLQPLRDKYERIDVGSGKRTPELNTKVNGIEESDHLFKGYSCAADFAVSEKKRLFNIYRELFQEYYNFVGEAILYFTKSWRPRFIHLSLPTEKHRRLFFYDYNYGEEFKPLGNLPDKIYVKIFKEER